MSEQQNSITLKEQVALLPHLPGCYLFSDKSGEVIYVGKAKSLKPRYNILLKDDKSYPWIALTAPPFERGISTRRIVKDGSRYFGP